MLAALSQGSFPAAFKDQLASAGDFLSPLPCVLMGVVDPDVLLAKVHPCLGALCMFQPSDSSNVHGDLPKDAAALRNLLWFRSAGPVSRGGCGEPERCTPCDPLTPIS